LPSGLLLVDKPGGPTSHGIVSQTRKALGLKKVGHAGTLDPMATGLLVLGVGQGTKLLTYCVGLEKAYEATIRLGMTTSTDDAEGESDVVASPEILDALGEDAIRAALQEFVGDILQVPSTVSAIRVDGKRAYERHRAGEEVVLAPRPVTISLIDVRSIRRKHPWWDVDIRVECSSGTYIRAIARDLGAALGVGGHLTALRRTRVGPFNVQDACSPEDISESQLQSLAEASGELMPQVALTAAQAQDMSHGKKVFLTAEPGAEGVPVACISPDGELVNISSITDGVARSLVGFPREGV
jgi:tRNA pseudouridine55 synthase